MHAKDVAQFATQPRDKISWIKYRPSFISQGGYSVAQFHIAGNSSKYIDIGCTEMYVKTEDRKGGSRTI